MICKVVYYIGGLYNWIIWWIFFVFFLLSEIVDYLSSWGVGLDYYQMIQIYMVFGGIFYYLKEVKQGKSVV